MGLPTKVTIDLGPIIKKIGNRIDAFILEFVQDINQRVVELTPVDTGFLRSSWYVAINELPQAIREPPPGLKRKTSRFKSAGSKRGAFEQAFQNALSGQTNNLLNLKLVNANVGDTLYIVNNASYAAAIEFGHKVKTKDGTKFVEGSAMVRKVYSMAHEMAEQAAQRVMRRIK
jgi:hypothetical protein